MAKPVTVTEACPFHQACDAVRRSEVVRFLGVMQLAGLRILRSAVDRRLAQLAERDGRQQPDVVHIPVTPERTGE